MKIRVQRSDGAIETLSLVGKWEVVNGEFQNRITREPRFDHWFTHDGYYDGWGGAICCDEQTAADTLDAMEQRREVVKS